VWQIPGISSAEAERQSTRLAPPHLPRRDSSRARLQLPPSLPPSQLRRRQRLIPETPLVVSYIMISYSCPQVYPS